MKSDRRLIVSSKRPVLAAVSALALVACAMPALAAPANVEGRWTDVLAWPRIPIHMALLPDGKVATFGATPQGGQGGLDIDIWTPGLGVGADAHVTLPNGINVDTFCAGLVLSSWSGDLVAVGGATGDGSSTLKASRFSYKTRTLTAMEAVKYPRWYSTTTTLPDGRIIVNGGVVPYSNSADATTTAELYTPGQGWRALTGTTQARQPASDTERRYWFPHVFATANNKVFVIAGKVMYQLGYDGNGSVGNFQAFNGPNWGGTSTAVMFAPRKVIQFGGGWTMNDEGAAPPGSKSSSIIDFSTYPYKVSQTGSMSFGRHWLTGTVLPTGEVLATGGAEGNNATTNVAYAAEIWNPQTGQWRTGASMKIPRLYHSTALLLPDGRILSGGGGAPGPVYGNNAEIYSPPYLFAADGSPAPRPTIATEPGTIRLGQTLQVKAGGDRPIARFTMIKTGAVTHGFNTDQRFLEVPFTKTADGYALRITNDGVDATPGYYLFFALDDAGVPSVGKMMRIPSPTADSGEAPPTGQTGETAGVGAAGTAGGNGAGGTTAGNTGGGDAGGTNATVTTPAEGTSGPLRASHSNLCLSVQGGSGVEGARLVQDGCNGSAIQTWTWRAANGGSTLVNAQTNKCLDLLDFKPEDGAALAQWTCNGGDNQIWRASPSVNGGLALASKQTGKCIDVMGAATQAGAQVLQWTCNGQANQSWKAPAPTAATGNAGGTQIGVEAAKVASAADGTTLVVNARTGIVWRSNTGDTWAALGTRAMREVATGGANRIYAIGADNNAYRWNGTDWIFIGPNARTIAAASDGTVVVTNPANEIWVKAADDYKANWTRSGGAARKVVAIGANRFWSVGLDGNVYRSAGNGAWAQMGTNVSDIAVASDGGVAVINKDTGETWRKANEDAAWTRSGGKALQVSAQSSGRWITVGTDNNVYRVQAN
ncbi:RICIN domain-containing protein [Aureimonas ureilytica]|uniref:RICIN domain-containing protein n=2 Tax=Aureimonas ureilytica TaxID=401562 RepID=UPI0003A1B927|nr:RICIN domain-containing protein [Aureimonas ureilytica]